MIRLDPPPPPGPSDADPDATRVPSPAPAPGDRAEPLRQFVQTFAGTPHAYDFRQALRRIDALVPTMPRLGCAARPSDEPFRIGHCAAMDFAPSPWARIAWSADAAAPVLQQRVFGFLGPNGPLPLHLTEYAREREMHHGDRAFTRFLDVIAQRPFMQFYRAWAQAQPVVGFDRPEQNRYAFVVGALCGDAVVRDDGDAALPGDSRHFFAGRLAAGIRSADGLGGWLESELGLPVRIDQNVPRWMPLESRERSTLGSGADGCPAVLGGGAVIGGRVWDTEGRFRIVIGPLEAGDYAGLSPGTPGMAKVRALVRRYLGDEFDWDVRLVLAERAVATTRIGEAGGRTAIRACLGRGVFVGRNVLGDRGELLAR